MSECTCLLCVPVEGKKVHPRYGYDMALVPEVPCDVCKELIGDREYVHVLGMVRFGNMSLAHKGCETVKMANARARMEKNRDKRKQHRQEEKDTKHTCAKCGKTLIAGLVWCACPQPAGGHK